MTDKQTTDRFKYDDRQAFEDIYIEYRQKLINFLQKYNMEDAEDIAEDTFFRLWDNRASIDPDKDLFNFICTIALNIVKNNCNHNNVVQKHALSVVKYADIEQISYSPEDEMIADDMEQNINHAVTKLTKKQQQIFHLLRIQGLTYKEIAQELGIKESTIETHIRNINRLLYKHLDG